MWRAVEVLRRVDVRLKLEQGEKEGKEKLIAIHGNRMVLYLVFRQLGPRVFDEGYDLMNADINGVTANWLNRLTEEILANHPNAYPASLFKNVTKCKAIATAIA